MHAYKLPLALALLALRAAGAPTPTDSQVPSEGVASILPVTDPETLNPVEQASTEVKRQEAVIGDATDAFDSPFEQGHGPVVNERRQQTDPKPAGGPVYVNPLRPGEKRQNDIPFSGPAFPPLPIDLPQKRQQTPWGSVVVPPEFEEKTKRQATYWDPYGLNAHTEAPQKRQEVPWGSALPPPGFEQKIKRQDGNWVPSGMVNIPNLPQKRQSEDWVSPEAGLTMPPVWNANNAQQKRQLPEFTGPALAPNPDIFTEKRQAPVFTGPALAPAPGVLTDKRQAS